MDKNKSFSACNKKLDKDDYKENRTTCKNCYNEKKRKNKSNNILIQNQQPKIDNVYTNNNNPTLLLGPSFSVKKYLMLKILSRISDRDIYIDIKAPPEQCSISKIKIKEITEERKLLNEYENAVIVFDDMLGSSNSLDKYQFFIGGGHKNLDFYYLSNCFFDSPKTTITSYGTKITLFNQTLKDIENIYRDAGGYDMSYDEFKELCKKSCEDDYNYLCIDRSKRQIKGDFVFVMEAKTHV